MELPIIYQLPVSNWSYTAGEGYSIIYRLG